MNSTYAQFLSTAKYNLDSRVDELLTDLNTGGKSFSQDREVESLETVFALLKQRGYVRHSNPEDEAVYIQSLRRRLDERLALAEKAVTNLRRINELLLAVNEENTASEVCGATAS